MCTILPTCSSLASYLVFLDLPIYTTSNGERPTPDNSFPLYYCGCKSHEDNSVWAEADGHGSMVWFNQASMMQTSETGIATLKEANELGLDTTCDAESWLDKGVFPNF